LDITTSCSMISQNRCSTSYCTGEALVNFEFESDGFQSNIFEDLSRCREWRFAATRYADQSALVIDPSNVRIIRFGKNPALDSPITGACLLATWSSEHAWRPQPSERRSLPTTNPYDNRAPAMVWPRSSKSESGGTEPSAAVLVLHELLIFRAWFSTLSYYVVLTGRYGLVAGLEYRP